MTYCKLKELEKRWDGYIKKSIRAYERNDNKSENKYADLLEKEMREMFSGIVIDWPGLAPNFNYGGKNFYTVESLLNDVYLLQKQY